MKLDKLEQAMYQEIAKVMTVGYEYHNEYGMTVKDPQIKPLLSKWVEENKVQIIEGVIKEVGKEEIIKIVTDEVIKTLTNSNIYSRNYEMEKLYKECAPLITEKISSELLKHHRAEICKE